MAEQKTYKCDVCGVLRGEANHWLHARLQDGGWLSFSRWNDARQHDLYLHICGHDCAHVLLSRHLEGTDSADKGAVGVQSQTKSPSELKLVSEAVAHGVRGA